MRTHRLVVVLGLLTAISATADTGKFGLMGGLELGLGSMSSSGGTFSSRTMDSLSLYAMPGYHLGSFMPGPFFEFRIDGQPTDPATVGNTNLKGSGWMLGIGSNFHYMGFVFMGGFGFLGQYNLSKNNVSNQSVSYKSPIGFKLLAGYPFCANMFGTLGFETISSGTVTTAGTDADASSDKLKENSFRIGLSVTY